jgi:hypothetical protein
MVLPILGSIAARIVGSVGARAVANQVGKSVVANTAKSEATGLATGRSVSQMKQGLDTARQVANTVRSVNASVQGMKSNNTPPAPPTANYSQPMSTGISEG